MRLIIASILAAGTALAQLNEVPAMGLGTWHQQDNGKDVSEIIANAIQAGYKHIDCAYAYENQRQIGVGIKKGLNRTGLQRSDLWITGVSYVDRHGREQFALRETLDQLGLDYIDLFLVHWPMGNSTGANSMDYGTTWKSMEALVNKGTRFIGISNFSPVQLQDILRIATIKPKVHEIEIHPYLPQTAFVQTNLRAGLTVIGYTPLANTNKVYGAVTRRATALLAHPVMTAVARERGCSAAQVAVAWSMKSGVVPIPKAANPNHQKENLAAADKCRLTDGDLAKIANIGVKLRMNGALCMLFNYACFAGLEG